MTSYVRLAFLAVTTVSSLALPGCIVVGLWQNYDSRNDLCAEHGEFTPDVYLGKNTRRVYLPFLRVDTDTTPHDLVLVHFDQNAGSTHLGFDAFVLESLELQFDGSEPVALISPDTPQEERTFLVAKTTKDYVSASFRRVFKGAITQREPFTLTMKGYAVRASGEQAPFTRTDSYRYAGQEWMCYTLMQELSGA